MSKLKFRLCDEDRAEFGGEEWEVLDRDRFENARAAELERYERQTGVPLQVLLANINGELSVAGIRALAWIAREQRGLRTPFAEFDIRPLKMRTEFVPDDEDVPAELPLDGSLPDSAN